MGSFIIAVANESSTETHRCSEAVVLKAEVWAWREEGLQLVELERAVEAHPGVRSFSEKDGRTCVAWKAESRHFRRRLGKERKLNMQLDSYEERVLEELDKHKHLNRILCGSWQRPVWNFCAAINLYRIRSRELADG